MTRILAAITFLPSIVLAVLVTIFCSVPIIITGTVGPLLPVPVTWREAPRFCDFMMYCQCKALVVLLHPNPCLQWEVYGLKGLSKKNWYLLIRNHRSWADIVVLCMLFRKHVPVNKYFLKQQLTWVPFLGLACWALNMPFMKRYSRAYLLCHPERHGKDVEAIRRSCRKFRLHLTIVINLVEGFHFMQEKHQQTHFTFQSLLLLKAAGIAMTLNILGKQFDELPNVTLCYPDNNRQPFFDMLGGRLTRTAVHVNLQPIVDESHGNYIDDKSFKYCSQ